MLPPSFLVRWDFQKKQYWHVLVAVPKGGEVALIDPALHDFATNNAAETMNLLTLSAAPPDRHGKVHFLTYS